MSGKTGEDHLVAAQPSVALKQDQAVWTNCTATDPCDQLAILDKAGSGGTVIGITGEDGQVHDVDSQSRTPYRMHPGRYRVQSQWPIRDDTFDFAAGHRYQLTSRSRFGGESTSWFEDVSTKRVVAGKKWCTADADCPESSCSKGAAKGAPGVCDIPELRCTSSDAPPGFSQVSRCAPHSAPH